MQWTEPRNVKALSVIVEESARGYVTRGEALANDLKYHKMDVAINDIFQRMLTGVVPVTICLSRFCLDGMEGYVFPRWNSGSPHQSGRAQQATEWDGRPYPGR